MSWSSFDRKNGKIIDSNSIDSVNFEFRVMRDFFNKNSIDYGNRRLLGDDGNLVVFDWSNFVLNDQNGDTVFNFYSSLGLTKPISFGAIFYSASPTYTHSVEQHIILLDTTSNAITFNLLQVANYEHGQEVIVKDYKNNSTINNITITCAVGDSIENVVNGTELIAGNGNAIKLIADTINNNWLVFKC